jgi:hypothetical protein
MYATGNVHCHTYIPILVLGFQRNVQISFCLIIVHQILSFYLSFASEINDDTFTEVPRSAIVVGAEGLTAVVMKRSFFCDITPCSPLSADVSEEHVSISGSKNRPSKKPE